MFESEDMDRLDSGKPLNGAYVLKVTNEALETHYINQMSLLTVDHPIGYEFFPDPKGKIILFGKESKLKAVSKSGRDIIDQIASRDILWYQSDSTTTLELTQSVTRDRIDVAVEIPQHAKKMYVAPRLRNTLLNTVLF